MGLNKLGICLYYTQKFSAFRRYIFYFSSNKIYKIVINIYIFLFSSKKSRNHLEIHLTNHIMIGVTQFIIPAHFILKGTLLHSLLIFNGKWHCASEMALKIICDHSNFPCLSVHMLAKSTYFLLKFVGILTP